MMMQEFTDRTGFEPTLEEYAEIENAYYEFDGDKDAFCADFVKNGGELKVYAARAQKISQLKSQMQELDKMMKQAATEYEAKIARLEKEIEREQEWKPYNDERLVRQEDYDHIRSAGREMTDAEAIEWIAQEFGFASEKIRINRTMKTFEINRHSQLRKVGEIDRRPMYDATDWYYIFFTVAGWEYEAYNGNLGRI